MKNIGRLALRGKAMKCIHFNPYNDTCWIDSDGDKDNIARCVLLLDGVDGTCSLRQLHSKLAEFLDT